MFMSSKKLSIFTLWSCSDGKEIYKKGAKLLFCQSKPIAFMPFSLMSLLTLPKLPNGLKAAMPLVLILRVFLLYLKVTRALSEVTLFDFSFVKMRS